MKTIKEWAKKLPKDYEVSILSQSENLDLAVTDLSGAISYFKWWERLLEGYDFWLEVSNCIENRKDLPNYWELLESFEITYDNIRAIEAMQGVKNTLVPRIKETFNPQPHYDNKHGSLYKIAEQRGWNTYQFDLIKRIDRALKKGQFEQDIDKTIDLLKLWKKEK